MLGRQFARVGPSLGVCFGLAGLPLDHRLEVLPVRRASRAETVRVLEALPLHEVAAVDFHGLAAYATLPGVAIPSPHAGFTAATSSSGRIVGSMPWIVSVVAGRRVEYVRRIASAKLSAFGPKTTSEPEVWIAPWVKDGP